MAMRLPEGRGQVFSASSVLVFNDLQLSSVLVFSVASNSWAPSACVHLMPSLLLQGVSPTACTQEHGLPLLRKITLLPQKRCTKSKGVKQQRILRFTWLAALFFVSCYKHA